MLRIGTVDIEAALGITGVTCIGEGDRKEDEIQVWYG